jgi:protein-export membrane protein, SecD/SecF family
MQNNGIIKLFAIALALVCLFYLSFTVVTSTYNKKAKEFADGDPVKEALYLDSVAHEKVWLGYTLKECRNKEINLGLDLKGGMNVTLEVSIPDLLRSLSGKNTSENFNKALEAASEAQKTNSQRQYIDLFRDEYLKIDPNAKLSTIFSTFELKEKITLNSTNDEVIRVLRNEIDDAISNSFNVLRTRIDRFGVVQPNIQRDNNNTGRILIELPGIKEPERVRKLLQGSANLEFWETYNLDEIAPYLQEANNVIASLNSDVAPTNEVLEDETVLETETVEAETDSLKILLNQTTESVSDSAKLIEQARLNNPLFALLDTRKAGGCLIGLVHSKDTAKVNEYLSLKPVQAVLPNDLGLRWSVKADEDDKRGEYFQLIAIRYSNRDKSAPLAGNVITDARSEFSQTSSYASVSMTMNSEGSKTWARLTKDNVNRSIAIALDGYIYSYPNVQNEITGGRSSITGRFTLEEANDLANTLKSGRMPAPARIVAEDVVGPSLGQEAINRGFISFIIAFIIIIIYMLVYYGVIPGLITDAALIINVFFLFGILASFSAVLTLPGIAGIVLTLGMAIDANILIYERIREELRAGKLLKKAIDTGFKNALSAIIDSNLTTFIAGFVLFVFGSGPVKGFATTLMIGIITSFVTAVFITRMLLVAYAKREGAKELPFSTKYTKNWLQNLSINFIGKRKIAYVVSGALILISLVSFATRGFSLGIDFSGGRNYVVNFENPVKTDDVRNALENAFEDASAQVITIGGAGDRVRISTKYKINENSETIDAEIEGVLFEHLKSFLPANTTKDSFVANNIVTSQKVGPTVADDIKRAAVWAVILAIIAIGAYVFLRFREIGYSLGAIGTLAHNTIVTLGLYSLLYGIIPFSMEIDMSFIAAILTVIGYSINDTVVIFDRIRENVQLYPKRDRKDVMNLSINTTLRRTFNTSFSTMLVLLSIFIFGGDTIRGFVFAMLFGIAIGTYSSIFVSAPLSYELYTKKQNKKALKA